MARQAYECSVCNSADSVRNGAVLVSDAVRRRRPIGPAQTQPVKPQLAGTPASGLVATLTLSSRGEAPSWLIRSAWDARRRHKRPGRLTAGMSACCVQDAQLAALGRCGAAGVGSLAITAPAGLISSTARIAVPGKSPQRWTANSHAPFCTS
jgi:hypothetical protein